MGVIAKGILRCCQGLFTPVSLGYPVSFFNKNSTLKQIVFLFASAPGGTFFCLEKARFGLSEGRIWVSSVESVRFCASDSSPRARKFPQFRVFAMHDATALT